jgi:oligopeptidase A
MSTQPFLPFEIKLDSFITALTDRLAANREKIAALLTIPHKTYANFVLPFEMLDEYLGQLFTPLSHLHAVNNSDLTQRVYTEALPLLSEYATEIGQNLEIYHAFQAIKAKEYDQLSTAQQRVLDLNIQGFELSGAHLDETTKARLKAINLRLSELSNDFSQNLLNATNAYSYIIDNEADMEGMPESERQAAAFDENGTTKYRFTLQMPSYLAYMTYGPSAKIREALYEAYTTRAPENGSLIDEILQLKHEEAKLLGFENYAEYSLATKMATSAAQAQQELQTLQTMTDNPLQSFDTAYYSEQLKQRDYEIDEEAYRPYFEQDSVMQGMFTFLHELFGVSFHPVEMALWDPKARAYDLYVHDTLRARLYFDLEARKDKRGGAWMHNWQSHCKDEVGNEQLASAFVVCNFPPSSDTHPSLLRHDDIVTLFHEMGHALHHLLSRVDEVSVSGVSGVEWDAVEFPSQFLENFAYEPAVLRLFAKHYQTQEVLPELMIERLVRAKNFQSALATLRQVEFAMFDIQLHSGLYQGEAIQGLLDDIRANTSLITPPRYNKFQHGFSHIFAGGYAAGYYSYKWAEVLSADAFLQVVKEGLFATATGQAYREIVLEGGGSQSMQLLFQSLMGREPEPEALLKLGGIV